VLGVSERTIPVPACAFTGTKVLLDSPYLLDRRTRAGGYLRNEKYMPWRMVACCSTPTPPFLLSARSVLNPAAQFVQGKMEIKALRLLLWCWHMFPWDKLSLGSA
jgi:hypothetical protein